MSNYVKPCTVDDARDVAKNLRKADWKECVEGHGIDPIIEIPKAALSCQSFVFIVPNQKLAGIVGIDNTNQIWMLCTEAIQEYPLTVAREAKRFIEGRDEPFLWCRADARNAAHLKLLKFLGFKEQRHITFGPNKLTFIEYRYDHWI